MHTSKVNTDGERLSGFFRFAQGVLAARDKVILRMRDTGFACFLENDIKDLPGLSLDVDDESWLVLKRLRETRAPLPEPNLADWLDGHVDDPKKPPVFKPVIVREVEIEEASDLCEADLLGDEDILGFLEESSGAESKTAGIDGVKVALRLERLNEIRADLEAWRDSAWETWAREELPVRKSIQFYNALFKLHNMLHGGVAATPPELVWGIGLARWKLPTDEIDMPLIEQLVDLEVQAQGDLVIRPRDVRPSVVMRAFLHLDVAGSGKTQHEAQELFAKITENDEQPVTPFDSVGWEPLLDLVAGRLSGAGRHIARRALNEGAEVKAPEIELAVYSTWAIYGRPRSENLREQDLERLREKIDSVGDDSKLPASMRGYVGQAPDPQDSDADDRGTRDWVAQTDGDPPRNTYFFPLPYNEEQAQIIDRLESEEVQVVSVTGPPGTGKTHSIANIIGHFMATGRRVLVTARTSEAIAAVRDKLPDELASLVIASVTSDREGVKQMEDAIQRLSDDVLSLNVKHTRDDIARLRSQILQIDTESHQCDQELAEIAKQNLEPLTWADEKRTAMEMAEILADLGPKHGWMADRPTRVPPEGLDAAIERLRSALPRLGEDLIYLGAELPESSEIPFAVDLIETHSRERAHRQKPREDFSGEPPMARDTSDAEAIANACHAALAELRDTLVEAAEWERSLLRALVQAKLYEQSEPDTEECVEAVWLLIGEGKLAPGRLAPGRLRYEPNEDNFASLLEAAARGRQGKAPVGNLQKMFNKSLVDAVASIRVDGVEPNGAQDWARVFDALKVVEAWGAIDGYWVPEANAGRLPELPELPERADELVSVVKQVRARIPALRQLAAQALARAEPLHRLFPYGLDVDDAVAALRIDRLLRALRANLKDAYVRPEAIDRLDTIAEGGEGPLFKAIGDLRDLLGSAELSESDIVPKRNVITEEIDRLSGLAEELARVGRDLEAMRDAGATQWASACLQSPFEAASILPPAWREAWDWAVMRARIDRIIALGNGDAWREKKLVLARRREDLYKQLIRANTLLGLRQRLTGPVQTALAIFTQGIRKLGKGTGKSAGRWRTAIRKAAMDAAPAVPVWVMPEYKIAEQLAPNLGDFDLVILDEASQSDVTAIAALARGKKHLIVGDEQQVSPAAVGIPQNKIDVLRAEHLASLPNKNVIDAGTSIFDIAMQMFPQSHLILREHFRCAEPIIQFSTRFYSNRLIPLRVPRASERFDPPLVDVFVKGAKRRGQTNEDEARFIVDEIAAIAGNPDHASRDIAVISLIGRAQAELIERKLMEDPRVGTLIMEQMRIVCGDSRTMQGQERSVVFLSMVATPGTAVMQSNQDTAQRYNVALSRARDRLYLVHSVSKDDLQSGDLKRAAIEHFANPMPGGRPFAGGDVLARCESGFEREVCQRLIDANYRVRSQVKAGPFRIDLVVEGADDRRLAIELDGDAWHEPEKWEQDMSRQAALERAGWTFWRVFGSQWITDRGYWWNNLVERLRVMGIKPIGAEATDETFMEYRVFDVSLGCHAGADIDPGIAFVAGHDGKHASELSDAETCEPERTPNLSGGRTRPDTELQTTRSQSTPTSANVKTAVVPISRSAPQPTEIYEPELPGLEQTARSAPEPSRFYDNAYKETLRSIVWDIVDSEGPIISRYLCERVARLHGFQRTGSQIKETIQGALKGTRARSHGTGDDAVFWPKNTAVSEWVAFRGLTVHGESRAWADVPKPEKLGLARTIVSKSLADHENAIREAIGIGRLRTGTRVEIKALLEEGRAQLAAEQESVQRAPNVSYLDRRGR